MWQKVRGNDGVKGLRVQRWLMWLGKERLREQAKNIIRIIIYISRHELQQI